MPTDNAEKPRVEITRPKGCQFCLDAKPLDFDITMAFQPIVDIEKRNVFAYEALVRGKDGAGAGQVLSRITEENRYTFDQTCRITAIELAAGLGMQTRLSINFLPNAVYRPETCIRATTEAADLYGFDLRKIMFEVAESEPVRDPRHLKSIFDEYKNRHLITAIDDFGSGYADMSLLARFRPDVLKLDMAMCQGVANDHEKQALLLETVQTANQFGTEVIAEGIESLDDLRFVHDSGIRLIQGYLFGKPEVEHLAEPDFSILD